MEIVPVPPQFRPVAKRPYPVHQSGPLIEQFADSYFRAFTAHTDRAYLPVFWTDYHVGGIGSITNLQYFINLVKYRNPGRKYWTICQLDGGTLIPDPDILVFASGGNNYFDIPIPLLCSPHPQAPANAEKTYLASFIGKDTHPVRPDLYRLFSGNPDYAVFDSVDNVGLFRSLMHQSKFALCPQGRCPATFRMYEAIQLGVVPVYISDHFWLPFEDRIDWKSFCVFVKSSEIGSIDSILRGISDEKYAAMQGKLKAVYENFFTFEKTCRMIGEILESEASARAATGKK